MNAIPQPQARRHPVSFLTVIIVAVFSVACTGTATFVADPVADTAVAESLLLDGDDLGPDWESSPRSENDAEEQAEIDAARAAEPACDTMLELIEASGTENELMAPPEALAESPDWASGDNKIRTSAAYFPTEAEAIARMEIQREAKVAACTQAAWSRQVDDYVADSPLVTRGSVNADEATLADVGDDAYTLRLDTELVTDARTITTGLEQLFVRQGRAVYAVQLGTVDDAMSIERDVLPLVLERLSTIADRP